MRHDVLAVSLVLLGLAALPAVHTISAVPCFVKNPLRTTWRYSSLKRLDVKARISTEHKKVSVGREDEFEPITVIAWKAARNAKSKITAYTQSSKEKAQRKIPGVLQQAKSTFSLFADRSIDFLVRYAPSAVVVFALTHLAYFMSLFLLALRCSATPWSLATWHKAMFFARMDLAAGVVATSLASCIYQPRVQITIDLRLVIAAIFCPALSKYMYPVTLKSIKSARTALISATASAKKVWKDQMRRIAAAQETKTESEAWKR